METVDITICLAEDGTYNAYCNDHPSLFGIGDTATAAKDSLLETLRITKEIGRESAYIYPDWLDSEFEFLTHWDVRTMLVYYSGIITPTALGKMAGIHPKQIWSYMHGLTRPRKSQVQKIESAVHALGHELINTCFRLENNTLVITKRDPSSE